MTELLLKLDSGLAADLDPVKLIGLAGVVVDGISLTPRQCSDFPVPIAALTGGSAILGEWREHQDILRIVDAGLDACARMRDEMPEQKWMPRLLVSKAETIFRMTDTPGEGFRFYAPDTSAIRGYRVTDGDRPLTAALQRARELGFISIWLHGGDAAGRGDGLELDLVHQGQRDFGDGLWISGGATQPRHLENLVREGETSAVVIDATLFDQAGTDVLTAALEPVVTKQVSVSCCGMEAES